MKKLFLMFALVCLAKAKIFAGGPDDVLGTWLTGEKDYKIQLTKNAAGEIEGHVVWMAEPNDKSGKPRTDVDNDDPALRSRPVMGLRVVWGFKYVAANKDYEDGKVYKKGNIYCGKMQLNPDGTLKLTGFVCKVSFLKKKDTWTRVK